MIKMSKPQKFWLKFGNAFSSVESIKIILKQDIDSNVIENVEAEHDKQLLDDAFGGEENAT